MNGAKRELFEYVAKTKKEVLYMNIAYRKAALSDIDVLMKLRLDYLTDDKGHELSDSQTAAISAQLGDYIPREIGNKFFAYIAELDGAAVSCVYMAIAERPANTSFITGKTATVLNVFTYPAYRKNGFATNLLKMMIEDAKTMQISYLALSASEAGKPIYEKLGFVHGENPKYTEMKLRLIETE